MTKAEAVDLFDGNTSALARALGVTPQAIQQWPDGELGQRRSQQVLGAFAQVSAARQRKADRLIEQAAG